MLELSSLFYIACLLIFVFGVFNGASHDKSRIKKSAIKAIAIVAIALIIVALI